MRLPKRFTLSTLLLVMLLVSLVFGYAQRRRQRLIGEIEMLDSHWRDEITLSNDWVWPTVNCDFVTVLVEAKRDGSFSLDGYSCNFEDVKCRYTALRDRFHAIGIEEVGLWLVIEQPRGAQGPHVELAEMVDGLESLDDWDEKFSRR